MDDEQQSNERNPVIPCSEPGKLRMRKGPKVSKLDAYFGCEEGKYVREELKWEIGSKKKGRTKVFEGDH